MSALVQNDRRRKIQIYLYTVSASVGEALLFVTLALGAAIKREFIYVSYSVSSDNFNLQGKKCQYSITNKVHIFAEVAQTYYTELFFFVSMN